MEDALTVNRSLLLACSLAFALSSPAFALPKTISYTITNGVTVTDGSDGSVSMPGIALDPNFQTNYMTVTEHGGVNHNITTIAFVTAFNGQQKDANGTTIGSYADIIFGGTATGYGIATGFQLGSPFSHGLEVGLYSNITTLSSDDLWAGRGVLYATYYDATRIPPTVITSGTRLPNVAGGGAGLCFLTGCTPSTYWNVSVDINEPLPFNLIAGLKDGTISVFWGTGDNGDGSFYAVPLKYQLRHRK